MDTAREKSAATDLAPFQIRLHEAGLRSALRYLNARTPHRFTGVFRFDGAMLRNVALVDKWLPQVECGGDVPLEQAYCAHLHRTGEPLETSDGHNDPRTPWMKDSGVISYCGAVIQDGTGQPWGALCHFDAASCDAKDSDMPLLSAAAALIFSSIEREELLAVVPSGPGILPDLALAAKGDPQAFTRLFDATAQNVLDLLRARGAEADTEAWLEAAYVRLWNLIPDYDPATDGRAWLLSALGLLPIRRPQPHRAAVA
jgi:hypothetical protein